MIYGQVSSNYTVYADQYTQDKVLSIGLLSTLFSIIEW